MASQQHLNTARNGGLCKLETAHIGGGEVHAFREVKHAVTLPVRADVPPHFLGCKLRRQKSPAIIDAAELKQRGGKVN